MSNFSLRYKLTWLPRLLAPQVGDQSGFVPRSRRFFEARRAVRIAFFGDISAVAAQQAPVLADGLSELLATADLVVGNCESPIVDTPRFALGTALGSRHAMPVRFVRDFTEAANILPSRLLLSVANNHALDQGSAGFDATLAAFDELGIRTVGATRHGPQNLEVGPLHVAFHAFTLWRNASNEAFAESVVMEATPSPAKADLICVLPHWGWEFRHDPQEATKALAARIARHGAGLIVGGHTHIVQPIERIGETLVAYSLGDFLGTAFRWVPKSLRTGAVLVVDVSADDGTRGKIAGYRYVPVDRVRRSGRERLTVRIPGHSGAPAAAGKGVLDSLGHDCGRVTSL